MGLIIHIYVSKCNKMATLASYKLTVQNSGTSEAEQ